MFNADTLKTMVADVVTQYVNQGVPLNSSITKIARDNSLNMEQTKRLVESANQVTYLKLMETAPDRTFQFPVADLAIVKAAMIMPDEVVKQASVHDQTLAILMGKPMTKQAEEALPTPETFDVGQYVQDAPAHLQVKMAMDWRERCVRDLDVLTMDMLSTRELIQKKASELRRDPYLQDKLKVFSGNGRDYVVGLLSDDGHAKSAGVIPFRASELRALDSLGALMQKAAEMVERVNAVRDCLDKMAGLVGGGTVSALVKADMRSPMSPGYRTTISHPAPTHMSTPQGAIGPGIWNGRSTAPGDGPTLRANMNKARPGQAQPRAASGGFSKKSEIAPPGTDKESMTPAQVASDRNARFRKSPIGRMLPKKPSFMGAVQKAEPLFFREDIASKSGVYDALHGVRA